MKPMEEWRNDKVVCMTNRHGSGVVVGGYLGPLFHFDALPLAFLQCTTAYVDVQTMRVGNENPGPAERVDEPFDDSMRPVRGRRERLADGATRELQVAQDRPDVGLWRGGRDACTADFRHCRDNEEGIDKLDGDSLAAVFFGESGAPGCEECFAARIGRQHGRGNLARKGANVQDQTVLPGEHEGQDELGDSQGTVDVDSKDIVHFLLRCLVEVDGQIVRAADIVHKDTDFQVLELLAQGFVCMSLIVTREVKRLDLSIDIVLRGDFIGQLLQLLWVAGDQHHAKASFRELQSELSPNPVGSPSND